MVFSLDLVQSFQPVIQLSYKRNENLCVKTRNLIWEIQVILCHILLQVSQIQAP